MAEPSMLCEALTHAGVLAVPYDPALWLPRPGGTPPPGWADQAEQACLDDFGDLPASTRTYFSKLIEVFAGPMACDTALLWCPSADVPFVVVRVDAVAGPDAQADVTDVLRWRAPGTRPYDEAPIIREVVPGWLETTLAEQEGDGVRPTRRLVRRLPDGAMLIVHCHAPNLTALAYVGPALDRLVGGISLHETDAP